jgi:hypothetical protein
MVSEGKPVSVAGTHILLDQVEPATLLTHPSAPTPNAREARVHFQKIARIAGEVDMGEEAADQGATGQWEAYTPRAEE